MSLLALAFGFASSVTNPFTVGVAQAIAGLPLFSGAVLRAVFFVVTYGIVFLFVYRYARKVERDPTRSLCYAEDAALRQTHGGGKGIAGVDAARTPRMKRASAWLSAWILLTLAFILVVVVTRNALPALSTYAFPVVGVFFLIAGLGAG
ncbi:MAG: YfcC family protein, partial [Acidobacteria bacterium]|nr:YfcC family protein [Acidobacteriota bacterium]